MILKTIQRSLVFNRVETVKHRAYASLLNDAYSSNFLGLNLASKSKFSTSYISRLDEDVLNKYKDKLQKKAESKGVGSVDKLLEEHFEQEKQTTKEIKQKEKKQNVKTSKKVTDDASQANLDKIMNLEKLKDIDPDSITKLWNAYHLKKECISAVLSADTYTKLLGLFKEYPCFIFPLPREQGGHEFYFMQSHYHQIYFTSLIELKTHTTQAKPHLIITHYPELIKEKQIVLMKGELGNTDQHKVPLSLDDSKLLTLMLQQFYLLDNKDKFEMVRIFNKKPAAFDHNKLVEEAAKL